MNEFTKGKVSDIPPIQPPNRPGWGLAQALREIKDDDAVFIPSRNHEPVWETQRRVATAASNGFRHGTFSTRRDHGKNGVWVFLRRNGGSA